MQKRLNVITNRLIEFIGDMTHLFELIITYMFFCYTYLKLINYDPKSE
jgi:hypothetical protein